MLAAAGGDDGSIRRRRCRRLVLRLALVLPAAYPLLLGAEWLGTALPWSMADKLLTAGLFAAAVYVPLLCWAAGAHRLMRGYLAALVPGVALVVAILAYSPFLQECCAR